MTDSYHNDILVNYAVNPCEYENYFLDILKIPANIYFNVNSKFRHNENVLFIACAHKHFDLARELLKCGADPFNKSTEYEYCEISNKFCYTAADFMIFGGWFKNIEMLYKGDNVKHINDTLCDGTTPLFNSIETDNLQLFKFFLDNGANPDIHNDQYVTILHYICMKGLTKYLKELVKHNVNFNVRNKSGLTPLIVACLKGKDDIVDILLKQDKVEVNASCLNYMDTFVYSFYSDNQNVIYKIYNHVTNINKIYRTITYLFSAVTQGNEYAVKLVLQSGINPNIKNLSGETALHIAVRYKNPKIIKLLLDYHSDIFCRSKQGVTPKELGLKSDHNYIRRMFNMYERKIEPLKLIIVRKINSEPVKYKLEKFKKLPEIFRFVYISEYHKPFRTNDFKVGSKNKKKRKKNNSQKL